MGAFYRSHISFLNGRDLQWPYFISQWARFTAAIFHFEMGVIYCGHASFRNGRDLPLPYFILQLA
jgi:hypothetical protein